VSAEAHTASADWWAPAAVATVSIGFAFAFSIVSVRLGTVGVAVEVVNDDHTIEPISIQLAQAFTAALNAHDVDALVELFTEDDAGPSVNADRYA
jgi:hypothetical protein